MVYVQKVLVAGRTSIWAFRALDKPEKTNSVSDEFFRILQFVHGVTTKDMATTTTYGTRTLERYFEELVAESKKSEGFEP